MAYHADAQDYAFSLYCQGLSDEEIEREMRKQWPRFTRQVLYGEGGWKKKFNWEERRANADAKRKELTDAIESSEELILKSLLDAIRALSEKIRSQGSRVDPNDLAQLNKLSTTVDKIRSRMISGGTTDKAAAFLDFLTVFISFLNEKDPELAAHFEAEYMDEFIERVKSKG